jgi:hypothetical protein
MKVLRLRTGPSIVAVAFAVFVSFFPAIYLLMVIFGKPTFKSFIEGPFWAMVATTPLWLSRRVAVVDPGSRRLRVRWGIWIPFLFVLPLFWRRYSLEGSSIVLLEKVVRGGDKGKTTYYVTRTGGRIVTERLGYRPARRDAERVAEALNLPMSDMVDNATPVTRPAQSVSKSLRKRLLDGEVASPEPRRPEWSDLLRRDRDGIFAIDRPAVRSFSAVYPTSAFYALLNGVVWYEYTLGGPASKENTIFFFIVAPILGIVGVWATLWTIHDATVQWSVELTGETLRVRKRSWIARSSRAMKLSELEELIIEPSIRVRSDRGKIEFAGDLDKEEREWVGHELLRRLRGP